MLVVVVVVTQYYSYSSYFGGHAAVFDSVVMCPARQRHTTRTVPAFFEAFLNGTSNVVYYSILLPSYLWRLGPSVRGRKVRQLANKQQQQQ